MVKKGFNTEDSWNDLGIYSSDAGELEGDELSPFEEAFMNGYDGG